jgi:signal transduction histidine kinase/ligand-binding sensor domain-containing protein
MLEKKTKCDRILFLTLVLIVSALPSLAQFNDEYIIESWKVEHGLPQHTVNDIAQTSDGFLWIGTEGGLARFDGFSFKVFDKSDSPVLSSNRISALAADKNNRLYIGNRDGGIGYYENGSFRVIEIGRNLIDMSVTSIIVGPDDVAYFCSKSFGLIRYKDGESYNYEIPESERKTIRKMVSIDSSIFLIYDHKIEKIEENKRITVYNESNPNVIANIYYDSVSKEYIILTKYYLLKKREFDSNPEIIQRFERSDLSYIKNPLSPFKGNYLLYMVQSRAYFYDLKSNRSFLDIDLFTEYPNLWINLVFNDKDGNIWIGTESSGLMRVRKNPFEKYPKIEQSGKHSSANLQWYQNNSLAIYRSESGDQYLSYLNSTNRQIKADGTSSMLPQLRIPTNTIYSFLKDAQGNLFLGSFANGVYLFQNPNLKLLHFPDDRARWVFALFQDTSGKLLVGTRGGGLFERIDDRLEHVKNAPESLKSANIAQIAEISDTLWVTSDVSIFSRIGNVWTDWSSKISISRDFFRGIAQIDSNFIVFGSYGNGLLFLNPKTKETKRLNVSNGLFDNVASYLYNDSLGNLWSTGNLGLTFISKNEISKFLYENKQTILATTYNKSHGSSTDEYQGGYQNSGIVLEDRYLILPGLNGFVKADIEVLISSKVPEKVYINNVMYGTSITSNIDSLIFDYGDARLDISYTAPFFSSNIKPIYQYMLVGYDQQWITGNELQTASYANLPPGKYIFKVRVGLRNGTWSDNDTSIGISIIPPFYMTDWFRIIVIVLFLGLIAFIIKLSNQKWIALQQKRFKLILEAQEQERKRIAADLHDGVGQLLSAVKLRLDYAKKKSSRDTNELNEIITESRSLLDNIADEIRNISYNLVPSSLKKFGLVKAIDETLQKTNFGHDLVIKFIPVTQNDRFNENIELTLYRIFQELLLNATKHANAKEIDIQLIEHQNEIILMFEDDGTGFDYQKALSESTGSGISNINSRVHILGGILHFDTQSDDGTTVTVTIPK